MTMTLDEAIAEVKRVTPRDDPWTGHDFSCAQPDYTPSDTDYAIAVILNAVASGDLIHASDARLAVALAYQRAAEGLVECSVWCDSQERTDASWHNGVIDARKHHTARILALAPADDLAVVQALRKQVERLSADNARLRNIIARAALTPKGDADA